MISVKNTQATRGHPVSAAFTSRVMAPTSALKICKSVSSKTPPNKEIVHETVAASSTRLFALHRGDFCRHFNPVPCHKSRKQLRDGKLKDVVLMSKFALRSGSDPASVGHEHEDSTPDSSKNGQPNPSHSSVVPTVETHGSSSSSSAADHDAVKNPVTLERDNSLPTKEVLKTWRNVDAVCFDVDCTITVNDSLDLLAEFMGVKNEVEELTNKAMDGSLSLSRALEERLRLIDCTPADIRRFLKVHPPESRLASGIKRLISALQQRGVAIYLISGGFRELTLPIAAYLNIPRDHVFANRMNWQWDDETGEPSRLVGFDLSEPTAHNRGKPQAIARIRQRNPYNTVVMVGDGITDLEAVQKSSGADLFIGYGGVIVRPAVASAADWYVRDYEALIGSLPRYKVAMLGSGAWACAVARMVAQNCIAHDIFDERVNMWVYEEEVEVNEDGTLVTRDEGAADKKVAGDEKDGGAAASEAAEKNKASSFSSEGTDSAAPAKKKVIKWKLTDLINEKKENPKYLPGIPLGANVHAVSDLGEAVKDADIVLLCAPHQFMHGICRKLEGKLKPGAFAMSLTKGMRVRRDGLQLISQTVSRHTGMDCAVLMGANIAADIGREELSEAVIGFTNPDHARILRRLIARPYFRISLIADPVGAEMCGTLKNIVAVAAGIVDGLGLGPNTKAAVLRQGLSEMRRFAKSLYPSVRDDTFLESCGVADLIATCYGGRNRAVAESWTKAQMSGHPRSFESLEAELLKGQKLQGVLTSGEVQEIIRANEWEEDYPLFTTVNRIITGRLHPEMVTRFDIGCMPLDETGSEIDEDDKAGAVVDPSAEAVAKSGLHTSTKGRHGNGSRTLQRRILHSADHAVPRRQSSRKHPHSPGHHPTQHLDLHHIHHALSEGAC